MSTRTDAAHRALAIACLSLRKTGHTNRQIARIQGIDIKRVPELIRVGERLRDLDASGVLESEVPY